MELEEEQPRSLDDDGSEISILRSGHKLRTEPCVWSTNSFLLYNICWLLLFIPPMLNGGISLRRGDQLKLIFSIKKQLGGLHGELFNFNSRFLLLVFFNMHNEHTYVKTRS